MKYETPWGCMTLLKVTETDAFCTSHHSFSWHLRFQGSCVWKCQKALFAATIPLCFSASKFFQSLESLSPCLDSTWKCKGVNALLIEWRTGVPGLPSFQWTISRCIPHGSSQSLAKSFWLTTAVLRSVMFPLLTSLVSVSLDSAPSWHQPPNSLHPRLCLILSFEWSQIFGGC